MLLLLFDCCFCIIPVLLYLPLSFSLGDGAGGLFSVSLFVICLFAVISGSVCFVWLLSFSLSVLCCLSSALLLRFLSLLLATSEFSKHTLILHCAIACHNTTSDKGLYSHRPPNNSDHYPLGIVRTGNNSDHYAGVL